MGKMYRITWAKSEITTKDISTADKLITEILFHYERRGYNTICDIYSLDREVYSFYRAGKDKVVLTVEKV